MSNKNIANDRVYLDKNNFIWEVYNGDQDQADVAKVIEETEKLIKDLQNRALPIKIIVDIREFKKPSLSARIIGGAAVARWPYQKMAVFGPSKYMYYLVNMIISATRTQNRFRIFKTKEEALEWLN